MTGETKVMVWRSAILEHVTCLTRVGPAAAPLTAVVVAGLKGLSSSEHNTNIALYSRVKKIEDRKGERVKESPQET